MPSALTDPAPRKPPFDASGPTTNPLPASCLHFELRNCRKCFSIFRFPRTSLGFSYCIIDCGCASCINTEQTALSPPPLNPPSLRPCQHLCTFSICIQIRIQMHWACIDFRRGPEKSIAKLACCVYAFLGNN